MVIVLKVTGFPFDATTRDLKEFFRGLRVRDEDIHIGHEKGIPIGFAVFSDDDAARRATTRSGQMLGPKRVTVMLSSSSEMDSVLSRRSSAPFPSRGSPPRRGRGGFAPSFRGRGRGRGGAFMPDRHHSDRSDRDFDSRHASRPSRGDRSALLHEFKPPSSRGRPRGSGLDEIEKRSVREDGEEILERKFVKVSGLPYVITDLDVQNFFRGILTREVYLQRHQEGRFVGRPNGFAIIEFFSEQDAREALERDGRRLGPRVVFTSRPRRDEIKDTIRMSRTVDRVDVPERKHVSEPSRDVTALPKNKEELTNLLQLFKTMIAAVGSESLAPEPEPKPRHKREIGDPVIRRVARNANINMRDIGEAKVVGIRNLPFSVTPEQVITFFRGYGAIPDSVRIHYSEDGKSSGDAIITFRSTRDAERAVSHLNKKTVGKRRVELFIM